MHFRALVIVIIFCIELAFAGYRGRSRSVARTLSVDLNERCEENTCFSDQVCTVIPGGFKCQSVAHLDRINSNGYKPVKNTMYRKKAGNGRFWLRENENNNNNINKKELDI